MTAGFIRKTQNVVSSEIGKEKYVIPGDFYVFFQCIIVVNYMKNLMLLIVFTEVVYK